MTDTDETAFVGGSGNVFADANVPDAGERHIKSQLAGAILDAIEAQGLSQRVAAERANVAQSDISNIVRGRVRGFSVARLLEVLAALGQAVDIHIRPVADGTPGHVAVVRDAMGDAAAGG